jgi:hypothetical protein
MTRPTTDPTIDRWFAAVEQCERLADGDKDRLAAELRALLLVEMQARDQPVTKPAPTPVTMPAVIGRCDSCTDDCQVGKCKKFTL